MPTLTSEQRTTSDKSTLAYACDKTEAVNLTSSLGVTIKVT